MSCSVYPRDTHRRALTAWPQKHTDTDLQASQTSVKQRTWRLSLLKIVPPIIPPSPSTHTNGTVMTYTINCTSAFLFFSFLCFVFVFLFVCLFVCLYCCIIIKSQYNLSLCLSVSLPLSLSLSVTAPYLGTISQIKLYLAIVHFKLISCECSLIDHTSFKNASIPFLVRSSRSFRLGENVSLVDSQVPVHIYNFTEFLVIKTTLFIHSTMAPILKNTMLDVSKFTIKPRRLALFRRTLS